MSNPHMRLLNFMANRNAFLALPLILLVTTFVYSPGQGALRLR